MNLERLVSRFPRPAALGVAAMFLAGLGVLDFLTGPEISFGIFYVAPVGLAAWVVGRRAGVVLAVCAAAVWLVADLFPEHYSHPAIAYWNAAARFGFFLAIALLLASLRVKKERLEHLVDRRTAALRDEVAEHKRCAVALRESEQRLRLLIEGARDYAFFMLDPLGCVVGWTDGAQRLLGYSAAEAVGKPLAVLFPPEDDTAGKARDALQAARADGTFADEGLRVRKDGSRFWAGVVLTALRENPADLRGFSVVVHDMTDRKQLENELLHAGEVERRRIGRDLHDILGQELTGVAFLSSELAERLADAAPDEVPRAARILRHVNQAIDRTRGLARGLAPVQLGAEGLCDALQDLAHQVEEVFRIPCRFHCAGPVRLNDDIVPVHLYRIAQEAVNNALKHARARRLAISLTADHDRMLLQVEDDGVGFSERPARSRGMGLRIMQHRAHSIGGDLWIEPRPTGGTLLTCAVPVARGSGGP